MAKTVLLIGAFDSKGPEYAFVRDVVLANGLEVITVNTGVLGTTNLFPVDIEAAEVAQAAGISLEQIRKTGDRGQAMVAMAQGAEVMSGKMYEAGSFDAIFGMGGSGGFKRK